MEKNTLKKLTALLLSISMVFSMVTEAFPGALAAGESDVAPLADSPAYPNADYSDLVTSRQPGLYVDFLGDNRNYQPVEGQAAATIGTSSYNWSAPGVENQSRVTNPNPDGGEELRKWHGYQQNETDANKDGIYYNPSRPELETIFWVGVGIDKMNELDLFQQDDAGVYSLELAFYYDSAYIEPYVPGKIDYQDSTEEVQQIYQGVIEAANLDLYEGYNWGESKYSIITAETGLKTQSDPVTEEVLSGTGTWEESPALGPYMDTILSDRESNTWRMTYVAIERKDDSVGGNRFAGVARTEENEDPTGIKDETKYLLIIPFRLKAWGNSDRLYLRLARNASLFSMGGGDDGVTPYAAWERTTTRNPGRELKLMTNFQGDLNIFDGGRAQDPLWHAILDIEDGGGSGNKATMEVDGDPSFAGVKVTGLTDSPRTIYGLPSGTGMRVELERQTGYSVSVKVYLPYNTEDGVAVKTPIPYTFEWDDSGSKGTITFVIPYQYTDNSVKVDILFQITDNVEFNLYLDERHNWEEPVTPEATPPVADNETVLVATYPGGDPMPDTGAILPAQTVTVDQNSPKEGLPLSPLPGEKVYITGVDEHPTTLEVRVNLHADYYADVEVFQATAEDVPNRENMSASSTPPSANVLTDGTVRVFESGTVVYRMTRVDTIVRVTYHRVTPVTGTLEVWHSGSTVKDTNVAQLMTLGYDDADLGWPAYSGVVYDKVETTEPEEGAAVTHDHRAVKDFKVLPWVETSAARYSSSLGGDGDAPVPWLKDTDGNPDPNSIMALLYSANTVGDFDGKVSAYDLRMLTDLSNGVGLRKNAMGEYYSDSELYYPGSTAMTGFYDRLLEFGALAATDPSLKVDVPDTDGSTVLFSYYNLTPDQLQVYLLDYANYEAELAAGLTPTAPVLRTDDEAKTELGNYTWYDPTDNEPGDPAHYTRPTTYPDFDGPDRNAYQLTTRSGREMVVVLESDSSYTVVDGIEIYAAAGYNATNGTGTLLSGTGGSVRVTKDSDYQNVYRFSVPSVDYIVKVVYTERGTNQLDLEIKINNPSTTEPVEPGNTTTVTAYVPSGGTTAKQVTRSEYLEDIYTVAPETTGGPGALEGSLVTVQVQVAPGYTASVLVTEQREDGTTGALIFGSTTDYTTGTYPISFRMPNQHVKIEVTYTRDTRTYTAYLNTTGATNGVDALYWEGNDNDPPRIKTNVPVGEPLAGMIDVKPGFYVAAVEAYTAGGAYAYTLSGNGWNNGAGGLVQVDTFMPNDNYFVRVRIAEGEPPEELDMALTLQVVDPDNTTPYVDNYATAQAVMGTVTQADLGPVGLVRGRFNTEGVTYDEGGYAQPATGYAQAGALVTVEAVVQEGYELDSIAVEPDGLGITPTYVGTTYPEIGSGDAGSTGTTTVRAQFVMPAASTRVIVTFRKSSATASDDRLFLHLNKTENGVLATEKGQGEANNTVTWVKSNTFDRAGVRSHGVAGIPDTVPDPGDQNTGVARPGEHVSFAVRVAEGWSVHSVTLTDAWGNRLDYEESDPTDPADTNVYKVISFVMPATDVTATVNYRKTTPDPDHPEDPVPDPRDRLLELVVQDPENMSADANNWAGIDVNGVNTIGPLGLMQSATQGSAYVRPGDQVTVSYRAVTGYTMDVISVTTDGANGTSRTVVPVYTEAGKATFNMPDANATVVVRFRRVTPDKPEQEYTANLILHMPAGLDPSEYGNDRNNVGEGTFGLWTMDQFNENHGKDPDGKVYSLTAKPGDPIDFTVWAKDGYYIARVTVTPAALGVDANYSGVFGFQTGDFVMPAANVEVNVFFVKLNQDDQWPKVIPYTVDLEVYDSSAAGSSYAFFRNVSGFRLQGPDNDPVEVHDGQRTTLSSYIKDGETTYIHEQDRITVRLEPDYDHNSRLLSVTVTDSRGRDVPWDFVPDGVAFDMPPAHVTVVVRYADWSVVEKDRTPHKVTLHMVGDGNTELTAGDSAQLGFAKEDPDAPNGYYRDDNGKYVYDDSNPEKPDHITVDRTTPTTGTPNDHAASIEGLIIGDILTLTATPDPDPGNGTTHRVVSAYGVTKSGRIIPTTYDPNLMATNVMRSPLIPDGGQVQFAVPDEDADVWVIITDRELRYNERHASLLVVGPEGAGSAILTGKVANEDGTVTTVSTRDVEATGGDSIFVPYGTPLAVDISLSNADTADDAQKYTIAAVRAMDSDGNDVPFTWSVNEGNQREFNLNMPFAGDGVQIYVELKEVDLNKDLTAQVVVNNAGNPGNTARLRNQDYDADGQLPAGTLQGVLLDPVHPGNKIYLDITVQAGYQIESIQVVPARLGIAPSLTKSKYESQTTSFTMREEDVVVYVHFVRDSRDRRQAILVTTVDEETWAEQYELSEGNRATISSDYSGSRGPIWPVERTGSTPTWYNTAYVQAAYTDPDPPEWVTVDYAWDEQSAVEKITVVDDYGLPVPFVQGPTDYKKRTGRISFPMINSTVTATVYYKPERDPVGYPAVLHVIDKDTGEELAPAILQSWAKLTWEGLTDPYMPEVTTGNITPYTEGDDDGNGGKLLGVKTIQVPAGQTVTVTANPVHNGVYFWAGYVLYRAGGQMIEFQFDPLAFTGDQEHENTFIMYPGQNDVYIYFTRTEPKPDDYAAVLMLDSPEKDTVSFAQIERPARDDDGTYVPRESVIANDPTKTHAYVTATEGETITVTVWPDSGYSIESILMTPLGVTDGAGVLITPERTADNIYTFEMPAKNVAILVKLQATSGGRYTAHLHYNVVQNGVEAYPEYSTSGAYATLTNRDNNQSIDQDDARLEVNEGTQVDLRVILGDSGYTVLAAYALRSDGQLVLLDRGLEGETAADTDSARPDSFIMPAQNVDVYVWFAKGDDVPDVENWHTAILVVTDEKEGAPSNSGLNSARYWSSENNPYPDDLMLDDPVTDAGKLAVLPHWVHSWGIHQEEEDEETGEVRTYATHGYFWVEEGETVSIQINDPAEGYMFSGAMLTPSGIDSLGNPWPTLDQDTDRLPQYFYTYTVGSRNSAVNAHFVSDTAESKNLNVVAIDKDNPGTDSNSVRVLPGTRSPLTLTSTTSAGARQVVTSVLGGSLIQFTVFPDEGYTAVAYWYTTGSTTKIPIALTNNAGSFNMPSEETTLEIQYFKARTATLLVKDIRGDNYGLQAGYYVRGWMTEDFNSPTITAEASTVGTPKEIPALPDGTKLTANLYDTLTDGRPISDPPVSDRLIGALVSTDGEQSWTWMSPDPTANNNYTHIIAGSDVTILLLVGPLNSQEKEYMAYVNAVNLPQDTKAPTIVATSPEGDAGTSAVRSPNSADTATYPNGTVSNGAWTVAQAGDAVTATIEVPYGYDAVVTVDGADRQLTTDIDDPSAADNPITIKGPDEKTDPPTVVTANVDLYRDMPARDVYITVWYVRTRFTAQVATQGTSGTASLWEHDEATHNTDETDRDYGALVSASTSSTPSALITDLKENDVLDYEVNADPGSTIKRIMVSRKNGGGLQMLTPNGAEHATGSIPMPADDVTVTAVFEKNKTNDYYLDLHVTGTQGGTATLVAASGTPNPAVSTPEHPAGLTRITGVPAGDKVTLHVEPRKDLADTKYMVTVTYYRHDNGTLDYTTNTVTAEDGGDITFDMPATNTCIYVTFRTSENPPSVSEDDPDNDPNHYLDLHVSGTNGGTARLDVGAYDTTSGEPSQHYDARWVESSPTAPRSVSTIRPVATDTEVKLTVTPLPGFTAMISYTVYHNGEQKPVVLDGATVAGGLTGTYTFTMPSQATCVYVTFRDSRTNHTMPYLDLHVSGAAGGTAKLETDGFGTLSSPPDSYGHLPQVEVGTPVKLTVEPETEYRVRVSYYRHDNGILYFNTFLIDTDYGGEATFDMPAVNTCIYVTFEAVTENDPKHPEEDPNGNEKYLDLHVVGTNGGEARLLAQGHDEAVSTPEDPEYYTHIENVTEGTDVKLTVEPRKGYAVTVSYTVYNGGVLTLKTDTITTEGGGMAEFDMPDQSTCVYVYFHKAEDNPDPDPPPEVPDPEPDPEEPWVAYVTVEDDFGEALNRADSIENTTTTAFNPMPDLDLWVEGVTGDEMLVRFTVAPGYRGKVTAYRDDGTDPRRIAVPVSQQGSTAGAATARVTMPGGTDVHIIITYTPDSEVETPQTHNLSLQLVGADDQPSNNATLTLLGTGNTLERRGTPDYEKATLSNTAKLGDDLYLFVNRYVTSALEYKIEKVTLEAGGSTYTYTPPEPDNNVNEYGATATSLFTMPDEDAVVTVYFRRPYKATLFVIDASGSDFRGDTTAPTSTNVPDTTMAVDDAEHRSTTRTHDPIEDLYGDETVTTTVDMNTMPEGAQIASVIATTSAGTVNLTPSGASGNDVDYVYLMSDTGRAPDDVDITVILWSDDSMHIATVYKVGHDNWTDNSADITDTTTSGLPAGTIWTGAYTDDRLEVEVTTHEGYYAIVTAVEAGTTTPVPVLQLKARSDDDGPILAYIDMPNANLDVTVTYTTEAPKSDLILKLVDHGGEKDNWALVNDQAAAALISTLTLNGLNNPDPVSKRSDAPVLAGTVLEVQTGAAEKYYVESVVLTISAYPGYELPLALDPSGKTITNMPVVPVGSEVTITVTFKTGQKGPRPFDPYHSETYNGKTDGGNYPDDAANPDLSTNPPEEEGWILADNLNESRPNVIRVDIPTLYDKDKESTSALEDAGVANDASALEEEQAPTYTFYWLDALGVYHRLEEGDGKDIKILHEEVVETGDFDTGSFKYDEFTVTGYNDGEVTRYGYRVTFEVLDTTTSPLEEYIQEGGTIYVTATKHGFVDTDDENPIPWAESDRTQVVIQPAKTYTATLRIVDTSSSMDNKVTMWVDEDTGKAKFGEAKADGEKLEKLLGLGGETLRTEVKPGDQVKVVSLLAVMETGSPTPTYLTPNATLGGDYDYPMPPDNVDVVVVLANEQDELYTATVVKVEDTPNGGNTVHISNQTHPVLNRDVDPTDPDYHSRWTLAYETDEIRVDVTAAEGYKVEVTARRLDGVGPNGGQIDVIPTRGAGEGTMVITLPDKMPASHIEITVEFKLLTDEEKKDQSPVTLKMRVDDVDGPLPIDGPVPADPEETGWFNQSEGSDSTTTVLTANSSNDYTDTQLLANGTLSFEAEVAKWYTIKDWYVDDTQQNNKTDTLNGVAISGKTIITVVLEEATIDVEHQTPRPFDPGHSDKYLDEYPGVAHGRHNDDLDIHPTEPHQEGYLLAENKGESKVEITVPNLYAPNEDLQEALYDATGVVYTLYAKIGGVMVKLIEGTDYDTVSPAVDYKHDVDTEPYTYTGQYFTIKSLDPTSALGEYVKYGGMIYITSTEPGKDESAYTEVVIPADPKLQDPDDPAYGYTATLYVIDDTTGTHNEVQMQNANDLATPVVTWDTNVDPHPVDPDEAGHIDNLTGGELIRTEVTPDPSVTYTVMSRTASMGNVLLSPDPTGTDRYRKTMPSEDMDIIVHFRDKNSGIYIAAVAKYGAVAVEGNGAEIENTTNTGLSNGTIWAEGKASDTMKVTVTLAEGYYAVVEAYCVPTHTTVILSQDSMGPGTATGEEFPVTFTMPASDVQVNVTFVKDLDDQPLRPFDPYNEGSAYYDPHSIRAENRGDYLIVTVPLLNTPQEDKPTSVDGNIHRFQLHLQEDGEGKTTPIINVTHLLNIVNVLGYDHATNVNTYYDDVWYSAWDPTSPAYPWEPYYENDVYAPDYDEGLGPFPYTGARFIVEIKDEEWDGDNARYAEILHAIIDGNDGTMGENKYRMYITSDEAQPTDTDTPTFRPLDYVDFEVPRYYTLKGFLESYAPQHTATFSLYRLLDGATDTEPWDSYEDDDHPAFVHRQVRETGTGLWQLKYEIKSSELLGPDGAGATYKLVIQKPGHVERTWAGVELNKDNLDEPDGLTFTVVEATLVTGDGEPTIDTNQIIPLFGGDVNQDGYARMDDHMLISGYLSNPQKWSRAEKFGDPDWDISVFNPESMAHQVDIDGDGYITVTDSAIWNATRNFNKNFNDYTPLYLKGDPDLAAKLSVLAYEIAMTSLEVDEAADAEDDGEEEPEEALPEGWPEIVVDPDLFPDFGMIPDDPEGEPETPEWPPIVVDPDLFPDFGVTPDDTEDKDDDYSDAHGQGPWDDPSGIPDDPGEGGDPTQPETPGEAVETPPSWPQIVVDPSRFPNFGVFPKEDDDYSDAPGQGPGGDPTPDVVDENREGDPELPDIPTENPPIMPLPLIDIIR